jgi:hypothetical protein
MPLLLAQLAGLVIALFTLALVLVAPTPVEWNSVLQFLLRGSRYAIPVLSIVGLAWLARGLTGAARTGARIAMVATAVSLVATFVWLALIIYLLETERDISMLLLHVQMAISPVCTVAVAVGLGMSTRRWFWIPIAVLVAVVADPIWFVFVWLHDGLGDRGIVLVSDSLLILQGLIQLAMVMAASRHATVNEEPAPVAAGLARSALALKRLAIATALVAGFTVLLSLHRAYDGEGDALLPVAVVTAFELACLCAFALGALSTIRGRCELPAWLVAGSAAVTLAAAGIVAMRVLGLVRNAVHNSQTSFPGRRWPSAKSLLPAVSLQLVVALAITAFVVALAIAARRRGLEELRARAITTTCLVVGLAIAAMTAQQVIIDTYDITPIVATILCAANAALVGAWLLAARLVRRAAGELAGGPYIPAAKLIR